MGRGGGAGGFSSGHSSGGFSGGHTHIPSGGGGGSIFGGGSSGGFGGSFGRGGLGSGFNRGNIGGGFGSGNIGGGNSGGFFGGSFWGPFLLGRMTAGGNGGSSRNDGNGNYGGGNGGCGCGGCITIIIITFVFLVIMGVIFSLFSSDGSSYSSYDNNETRIENTTNREKLTGVMLHSKSDWIDDRLGWLKNEAYVKKGMQHFKDETGVEPYLIIAGDNQLTSDSAAEKYLKEKYDDLFDDTAHMILLFNEPTESDYWYYIQTGKAAEAVIDDEARGIVFSYINVYYTQTQDMSDDEYFYKIFYDSADKMMEPVKYAAQAKIFSLFVLLIIIIIIAIIIIRKQQLAKMKMAQDILNADVENGAKNVEGYYNEDDNIIDVENKYK